MANSLPKPPSNWTPVDEGLLSKPKLGARQSLDFSKMAAVSFASPCSKEFNAELQGTSHDFSNELKMLLNVRA